MWCVSDIIRQVHVDTAIEPQVRRSVRLMSHDRDTPLLFVWLECHIFRAMKNGLRRSGGGGSGGQRILEFGSAADPTQISPPFEELPA